MRDCIVVPPVPSHAEEPRGCGHPSRGVASDGGAAPGPSAPGRGSAPEAIPLAAVLRRRVHRARAHRGRFGPSWADSGPLGLRRLGRGPRGVQSAGSGTGTSSGPVSRRLLELPATTDCATRRRLVMGKISKLMGRTPWGPLHIWRVSGQAFGSTPLQDLLL